MPDSQLEKLQIIQNRAARLITGTKKYSPITPVLQQLHWLPVTVQCLHNMAPSYLQELLNKYTPTRNLRSSQKGFMGNVTFSLVGHCCGTLFTSLEKRLTLSIILSHFENLSFPRIFQLRVTIYLVQPSFPFLLS